MYLVISCFRIGNDKKYRKVMFYEEKDAQNHISETIKTETIVLYKRDTRQNDRRGGGRK